MCCPPSATRLHCPLRLTRPARALRSLASSLNPVSPLVLSCCRRVHPEVGHLPNHMQPLYKPPTPSSPVLEVDGDEKFGPTPPGGWEQHMEAIVTAALEKAGR